MNDALVLFVYALCFAISVYSFERLILCVRAIVALCKQWYGEE